MGKPPSPGALSSCRVQTVAFTSSSITSLVREMLLLLSIILGICLRNSSGFSWLSRAMRRFLKWLKASFFISSCPFNSFPYPPVIFSMLFFIILVFAELWKKEVFLSPTCIHNYLDLSLQVSSSFLLFL